MFFVKKGTKKSSRLRSCLDRKSTRLNSSHRCISYAVFCLKKKKNSCELLHHAHDERISKHPHALVHPHMCFEHERLLCDYHDRPLPRDHNLVACLAVVGSD